MSRMQGCCQGPMVYTRTGSQCGGSEKQPDCERSEKAYFQCWDVFKTKSKVGIIIMNDTSKQEVECLYFQSVFPTRYSYFLTSSMDTGLTGNIKVGHRHEANTPKSQGLYMSDKWPQFMKALTKIRAVMTLVTSVGSFLV